jgi:hypothetical protein
VFASSKWFVQVGVTARRRGNLIEKGASVPSQRQFLNRDFGSTDALKTGLDFYIITRRGKRIMRKGGVL